MQLQILGFDGTHITETNDVPPERWLRDWSIPRAPDGTLAQPDPTNAGQLSLLMAEILIDVVRIVNSADKPRDAADSEAREQMVAGIEIKCATYCLNNPVIMQEFDAKSATHNLFVKIFSDHIEAGWTPRRVPSQLH